MSLLNKGKLLDPNSEFTLNRISETLDEVCKLLDRLYDINCGGCCYVAYCISKLLYSDNIRYSVEVISFYEDVDLEEYNDFTELSEGYSHYGISLIGDRFINITEEDIDGCESHTSFINVYPFQLKKHYNTNYWNSCYDTDKNKFIWNTIKNFYYECTKDLRE